MECEPGNHHRNETTADQELFMEKLQELKSLGESATLTLTNVYKELPITHPAAICSIEGKQVELKTSDLQVAAISQCNEAYLQSPLLNWTLLGRLYSIDVRRSAVKLSDFKEAELEITKRRTLRVRLKKPVNVQLHLKGEGITGVIRDISLGGCCMNTLSTAGLKEAQKLEIEMFLAPETKETFRIPCTLLTLDEGSAPFRCTFRFDHTTRSEQLLAMYINQRQLEILKELRGTLHGTLI